MVRRAIRFYPFVRGKSKVLQDYANLMVYEYVSVWPLNSHGMAIGNDVAWFVDTRKNESSFLLTAPCLRHYYSICNFPAYIRI